MFYTKRLMAGKPVAAEQSAIFTRAIATPLACGNTVILKASVDKLALRAQELTSGDPRDERNALGTLINREAGEKLSDLIEDTESKGAHLVAGGQAQGVVMQATVMDKITHDMRLYSEASFGPLVAVIALGQ